MEGPDALARRSGSLEGFEAPAKAWETEILPARLKALPGVLARRPMPGRADRLGAADAAPPREWSRRASATPVGATPIALVGAPAAPLWIALTPLTGGAAERPRRGGARLPHAPTARCSSTNWRMRSRLLRTQVEEALGELVALGLVDFRQLRRLAGAARAVRPAQAAARREAARARACLRHRERRPLVDRSAAREPAAAIEARAEAVEHVARVLLRRYGVVFWRLLEREGRDGCRRGATCCASTAGSRRAARFAAAASSPASPASSSRCPDAVGLMREIRRKPASGEWVSLSGADPLNLVGILTPGPRLAALTANRVVYRDGLPIAALTGGKAQFLTELEGAEQWEAEKRLVRSAARGMLADLV